MAESKQIKERLTHKSEELGNALLTIIFDIVLFIFWIVVEFSFEHYVVRKFPTETWSAKLLFILFRIWVGVSILYVIYNYSYEDFAVMHLRRKDRIKRLKNQLAGLPETAKESDSTTKAKDANQ